MLLSVSSIVYVMNVARGGERRGKGKNEKKRRRI
jgi:hypothetical protein